MNTLPSIEIAVSCCYFQKRLCWMLSSILQQEGSVPPLVFNIGYAKGNGNPTTERVCKYFRDKGLNITTVEYDGTDRLQYRGLVRNDQLQKATCDWILFADTDMVYHPDFFSVLATKLATELNGCRNVISSSRVSLAKDYCKDFFNTVDTTEYPAEISEVAKRVKEWPIYQISKNVGAGYFQLANMNAIRDMGGMYVEEDECRDWSWTRGQKANSDKQFRRRMGGITKVELPSQWHLNHERDNEAGEHLTIQR